MNVVFEDITYSNIMSVGAKPIHVKLNGFKKTLITGRNGAGKSTMLEALCFLLYGRPFRDIKKTQLVNSINRKGLLVEGNFSVGPNRFYVKRGIKPNILEIHKNGEKIPELASVTAFQEYFETELLGISFASFKQVIVLGTAGYTPFMELAASDRRTMVEDLLDLLVLGDMEKNNKGLIKVARQQYDILGVQIESNRKEQEIAASAIREKTGSMEQQRNELMTEIRSMIERIQTAKTNISSIESELASIVEPDDEDLDVLVDEIRSRLDVVGFENTIRELESTIQTGDDIETAIATASERLIESIDEVKKSLASLDSELITDDDVQKLIDQIPVVSAPDIDPPTPVVYPPNPCPDRTVLTNNGIQSIRNELGELGVSLEIARQKVDFVTAGGECPTCGTVHQASSGHVSELESRYQSLLAKYDAKKSELESAIADHDRLVDTIAEYDDVCSDLDAKFLADKNAYEKACADYAHAMREYGERVKSIRNDAESKNRTTESLRENYIGRISYFESELGKVADSVRGNIELKNDAIRSRISEFKSEIERQRSKIDSDVEAVKVKWTTDRGIREERRKNLSEKIEMLTKQNLSDTAIVKDKKKKADELLSMIDNVDTSVLNELKAAADELSKERVSVYEEISAREVISVMLKDTGIKAQVVRQYIPVFNKRINGYLQTMGADYVFTLDETFNESIKSRGREEFTYTSFSQGERARINVALLFTWRDIASIVSGVNINLLVLDELFDSATDAEGVKDINTLLDRPGSNVFVISHRAENMNDSFDCHLKMVKKGRFTVQE